MESEYQEVATVAGGCFWCTEAIFKRLKGITSVIPGYAGGPPPKDGKIPTYEEVCSGTTGHAESVEITFSPGIISYETLLEVFFHLHDPGSLNRQGNDVGTQYRSVIFYHSEAQKNTANMVKERLVRDGTYKTIITETMPYTEFYPAETYHQNFYEKNTDQPYCQYIVDPKIQKLMKDFPDNVKEEYK